MLIISNLYKSFGEKPLFRDFNLELKDKQSLCIMGSSGCGKTTLLNIIMGLEPYESGSVLKDARKISAVFQEDRLIGLPRIAPAPDRGYTGPPSRRSDGSAASRW